MGKQQDLYEILQRLTHPAIPEVIAYIKMNTGQRICRELQGCSYQNILYYLEKLQENGKVHFLTCSSGYRNRYCFGTELEEPKSMLHSIVRFIEETSGGDHVYALGRSRIKICSSAIGGKVHRSSASVRVLLDSDLARYYVVDNTLFLGVIQSSNMQLPRLPGSTYGWGTEYERCLKLMRSTNGDMRILGIKGERKVTGE